MLLSCSTAKVLGYFYCYYEAGSKEQEKASLPRLRHVDYNYLSWHEKDSHELEFGEP